MYTHDYQYIENTGNINIRLKCDICGSQPAWAYTADCCGDSVGPFCKEHWQTWLNEFLDGLTISDNYKEIKTTEDIDEKYKTKDICDRVNAMITLDWKLYRVV